MLYVYTYIFSFEKLILPTRTVDFELFDLINYMYIKKIKKNLQKKIF